MLPRGRCGFGLAAHVLTRGRNPGETNEGRSEFILPRGTLPLGLGSGCPLSGMGPRLPSRPSFSGVLLDGDLLKICERGYKGRG